MTRPIPIAPMMVDMVRAGISAQDGTVYTFLDHCPDCGRNVRPYDFRTKRFAKLVDGQDVREVRVRVKRFRCAGCGRLCYAESPFYPETRHGAPIVELAAALSERMPPGQVAKTLARLGILLDRATIRGYARLPLPPITTLHLFGLPIPVSVLRLSCGAGASMLSAFGHPGLFRGSGSGASVEQRQQGQEEHHEKERKAEQEEDGAHPE